MRNRRAGSSPIDRLRLAIDCMPVATRRAMLEGLSAYERIIVGAYVDGQGGVCPMLAAHRCGGRTDLLAFARAWDRFARSRGAVRVATEREVRTLIAQLRASLEQADGLELDRAIAEHRALLAASHRREGVRSRARPLGDRADPHGEIRVRRLVPARLRRPRRGRASAPPAGVG